MPLKTESERETLSLLERGHNSLAPTTPDDARPLDRRYETFEATSEHSSQPLPESEAGLRNVLKWSLGRDVKSEGREGHSSFRAMFSPGQSQRSETRSRYSVDQSPNSRRSLLAVDPSYAVAADVNGKNEWKEGSKEGKKPKLGSMPRPIGGFAKLGTFDGVFVPTSLNVLSILMFLRFGFILGQSGFLGMMAMLVLCYLINLVTTMSISAIATNGTVRGGGAYYLISRSLGPEFGGSIGIVFYLGFAFNTGLNAVGLVDCLTQNFGAQSGNWSNWLPDGGWWQYFWSSIILLLCTCICLAGSGLFARCSSGLLVILLVATFSIPISTLFVSPFETPSLGITYTGLSFQTFMENLKPHFTKGAAGGQMRGRETYQDLFGILFPATGGIFAGASMSGDLRKPSHSIPRGTLYGLVLTFVAYSLVILAMACSINRASLYRDVNVIQDINISGTLVLLGEFATSFFSSLMGVIGSAKLLQALARDQLLPGLSIFGQGTKVNDEPVYAILVTYAVAQVTMLMPINQIASFVTMTYLMTFLVTNLACFLLKVSSAPNFRPAFHYFRWWTAALGTLLSGASMFFVDGVYASGSVGILVMLFLIIHYTTLPKSWGDVSQGLIYHQVRKYLLRLRQEHVKFWRPQILLFVNDPRRSYKLIQFCNSLKKGSLFILGHVIVTQDFAGAVPEARKQQSSWMRYIDFSKIKAFVNVAISPEIEWGTRNVVLSAGLGGMRPNIVVMGFYNLEEYREGSQKLREGTGTTTVSSAQVFREMPSPKHDHSGTLKKVVDINPNNLTGSARSRRKNSQYVRMEGDLPTDDNRSEKAVGAKNYVTVLEDLLLRLQINVAIAKNFGHLELPYSRGRKFDQALSWLHLTSNEKQENTKRYIDLWPIQMTAEITTEDGESMPRVSTTNFDTYTLILQLGCILHTVDSWKHAYKLRVAVFVEYESDVEEEQGRVETLLSNLRIEADVSVFWLASGELKTYEIIVNGSDEEEHAEAKLNVNEALKDEEWWQEVQDSRSQGIQESEVGTNDVDKAAICNASCATSQTSRRAPKLNQLEILGRKLHQKKVRRSSMGDLSRFGVSLTMQTHRLDPRLVENHRTADSASTSDDSEDSSSDSGSDAEESQASSGRSGPGSTAGENALSNFEFESQNTASYVTTPPETRRNTLAEGPQAPQAGTDMSPSHTNPAHDPFFEPSPVKTSTEVPQFNDSEPESPTADAPPQVPPQASFRRPLPRHLSQRPPNIRYQSHPRLTSQLVPRTTVATDEGIGPSIMFSTPSPPTRDPGNPLQSIYDRYRNEKNPSENSDRKARPPPSAPRRTSSTQSAASNTSSTRASASGYPSSTAQPLSFNALPCRAQHLILNELMRMHSGGAAHPLSTTQSRERAEEGADQGQKGKSARSKSQGQTAVIFTTLPAPVAGTGESEEDSLAYLGDLETLCRGLPPVLMVHSNSMSVTMSL